MKRVVLQFYCFLIMQNPLFALGEYLDYSPRISIIPKSDIAVFEKEGGILFTFKNIPNFSVKIFKYNNEFHKLLKKNPAAILSISPDFLSDSSTRYFLTKPDRGVTNNFIVTTFDEYFKVLYISSVISIYLPSIEKLKQSEQKKKEESIFRMVHGDYNRALDTRNKLQSDLPLKIELFFHVSGAKGKGTLYRMSGSQKEMLFQTNFVGKSELTDFSPPFTYVDNEVKRGIDYVYQFTMVHENVETSSAPLSFYYSQKVPQTPLPPTIKSEIHNAESKMSDPQIVTNDSKSFFWIENLPPTPPNFDFFSKISSQFDSGNYCDALNYLKIKGDEEIGGSHWLFWRGMLAWFCEEDSKRAVLYLYRAIENDIERISREQAYLTIASIFIELYHNKSGFLNYAETYLNQIASETSSDEIRNGSKYYLCKIYALRKQTKLFEEIRDDVLKNSGIYTTYFDIKKKDKVQLIPALLAITKY